jgi:hypothetical protein
MPNPRAFDGYVEQPVFTHDMTITTKEKRAKEPLSPVQAALAQRLRVLREARFQP